MMEQLNKWQRHENGREATYHEQIQVHTNIKSLAFEKFKNHGESEETSVFEQFGSFTLFAFRAVSFVENHSTRLILCILICHYFVLLLLFLEKFKMPKTALCVCE